VQMKVVEHESPPEAALEEAKQGYDLVVVSVGSEWGLEQKRFGLFPEQIMQECPTSMLVVRQYEGGARMTSASGRVRQSYPDTAMT
jgi:hypothetical protein